MSDNDPLYLVIPAETAKFERVTAFFRRPKEEVIQDTEIIITTEDLIYGSMRKIADLINGLQHFPEYFEHFFFKVVLRFERITGEGYYTQEECMEKEVVLRWFRNLPSETFPYFLLKNPIFRTIVIWDRKAAFAWKSLGYINDVNRKWVASTDVRNLTNEESIHSRIDLMIQCLDLYLYGSGHSIKPYIEKFENEIPCHLKFDDKYLKKMLHQNIIENRKSRIKVSSEVITHKVLKNLEEGKDPHAD